MNAVLRTSLVVITLFAMVVFSPGCGGSDSAEQASGDGAGGADSSTPAPAAGGSQKAEASDKSLQTPEAAMMKAKLKEMAAQEGIYFSEVPEGFPLEIIPVHPDGAIDKSSTGNGDFTLLQAVAQDKDSTMGWFREHYEDLDFNLGDAITVMGRTMITGSGPAGELSLTFIDQEEGKTFVAQVLSPR